MNNIRNRLIRLQELLIADEAIQELFLEYDESSGSVLELWERMPQTDREIWQDHMGILAELHNRVVLLACREMRFPDET